MSKRSLVHRWSIARKKKRGHYTRRLVSQELRKARKTKFGKGATEAMRSILKTG